MSVGKSYYHAPQKLGKAFDPDKLKGYFNDLTAKTDWKRPVDSEGIPVNQLVDGSFCYLSSTVMQKALGHYDKYILTNNNGDLDEFLKICDWLLEKQDRSGGWDFEGTVSSTGLSKYSAMSQGEALSALARAWQRTHYDKYIKAAEKAYHLMVTPIERGGTARFINKDQIYLEKYPTKDKNTILNGWVFALLGIYDLFLVTDNDKYRNVFYRSLDTLINNLHIYDAGYWSYYDEQKSLASPFYHDLHISQMEALYLISGNAVINHYIKKWNDYKRSVVNRSYAFIAKAYQKILKPQKIIIVK